MLLYKYKIFKQISAKNKQCRIFTKIKFLTKVFNNKIKDLTRNS